MPKIVVYAIAKDEETSARAWAEAVKEADQVVVLDTGSTDRTPEIFREYGFSVFSDFAEPFRFDRARNHALSHVPADADWCFSIDIDEIFEPGWRAAIEKTAAENPQATQIKYPFVFTHRTDPATGAEIDDQVFYKGNCHRRRGWKWTCPCHEVLISETTPIEATAKGCRLHHRTSAKPRRFDYLALLERGAKDEPNDARVHYYLGREYLYRGQYKEAGETLVRYLDLAGEYCWHGEKGNAILMIADSCAKNGDADRAESWALRAIAETDGREPYLFLARLYYQQKRWWECRHYAEAAVRIGNNLAYYRDPEAYRAAPWDLLAMSAFKLGDRTRAKQAAAKCLEFEPTNERFRANAAYFGVLAEIAPGNAGKTAGAEETDESRELAVAYSITRNFAEHAETAIYSLLKNNRVRDLYIIIEGDGPAEGISRLAKAKGVRRVHWFNLDAILAKALHPGGPNDKPVCSRATLGRLFLAEYTREQKILYLDCDTIVHGNLSELWSTDLDGIALAGTIDRGAIELWGDYTKTLTYGGIPGYLNAGVLMMNLDLIRALKIDKAALDLLNTHFYQFADQDVLNITCKGRTRALDHKWNSGRACGYHPAPTITHLVSIAEFWETPEWGRAKAEYDEFKKARN